jgi:hypothetical protein
MNRSRLGMSGHYAAMSEFLYRGYNVAIPSVDIGDEDQFLVAPRKGIRSLRARSHACLNKRDTVAPDDQEIAGCTPKLREMPSEPLA